MKRILSPLAMSVKLLPALAASSFAFANVAVLETTPNGEVELSIQEFQHLTDELRSIAAAVLPQEDFAVLTRDGILALMPPDEEEAECLAEGCAVDIGREIGAEYVAQGKIGMFGGQFAISVELYESMGGKLLGSFVGESDNIRGLLEKIRSDARELFGKIPGAIKPAADKPPPPSAGGSDPPAPTPAPPPPEEQPSRLHFGVTAGAGFAKTGAEGGKSGLAYSLGVLMAANLIEQKKFGLDFVSGILFSSENYKIAEEDVSGLSIEIPLTARFVFLKNIGVSLGAVAALPLSAKIGDIEPKDRAAFTAAATGGLAYIITESIFVEAVYEKYFTEIYSSVKNSNQDKVLCKIGYLF